MTQNKNQNLYLDASNIYGNAMSDFLQWIYPK